MNPAAIMFPTQMYLQLQFSCIEIHFLEDIGIDKDMADKISYLCIMFHLGRWIPPLLLFLRFLPQTANCAADSKAH